MVRRSIAKQRQAKNISERAKGIHRQISCPSNSKMPANMAHADFPVTFQVVLSNNVAKKIPIDKFKITIPKPQFSPNNSLIMATIVTQL